ncbi:MAG: hypothetical protein K0U66_07175 [Gammaproteobacteria bacterium]|nr:hypothetical protein [Gammaproteobacteria bacterium]
MSNPIAIPSGEGIKYVAYRRKDGKIKPYAIEIDGVDDYYLHITDVNDDGESKRFIRESVLAYFDSFAEAENAIKRLQIARDDAFSQIFPDFEGPKEAGSYDEYDSPSDVSYTVRGRKAPKEEYEEEYREEEEEEEGSEGYGLGTLIVFVLVVFLLYSLFG